MASKKIAETALEHAPKADVESFCCSWTNYKPVAWLVRKLSDGRYSSLHGGGQEAEAVQVWNTNVGALMLRPRIRSYLITLGQLFIHFARVLGFSKLVWHRTTKDEFLVETGRSYFDKYCKGSRVEGLSTDTVTCCCHRSVRRFSE